MRTEKAQELAQRMHAGQKYGDKDHIDHCADVVGVLGEFGVVDVDILAAAWCHDVLEDTTMSYNDVMVVIGTRAANIVYDVTNELGKNRKERAEKTYPKIRANSDAVIVKLADRIANMRYSLSQKSSMYTKYVSEYPSFREALYSFPHPMWEHLDEFHTNLISDLTGDRPSPASYQIAPEFIKENHERHFQTN